MAYSSRAFMSGLEPFKPFGTIQKLDKSVSFRVQQDTQVRWTWEDNRGNCSFDIDLTEDKDRVLLSTECHHMFEGERALNPECSAYFKTFGRTSKPVRYVDRMFAREEGGWIFIEVPFVRLDEVLKKFVILEEARVAAQAFWKAKLARLER